MVRSLQTDRQARLFSSQPAGLHWGRRLVRPVDELDTGSVAALIPDLGKACVYRVHLLLTFWRRHVDDDEVSLDRRALDCCRFSDLVLSRVHKQEVLS